MQEFMDFFQAPVDALYTAAYLALPTADRTHTRENECRVMIYALAKECFLMGVNQAIRNMHMQKRPVALTEAIQEAMRLELINESNGTKNKIADLADVDDKDLAVIVEDLDDLTIKGINTRRAKSGRQPSRQTSQFAGSKGKGGKGKTGRDKSAVKCCYCNKEGHLQQECYTRIKKSTPCVDRTASHLATQASWPQLMMSKMQK